MRDENPPFFAIILFIYDDRSEKNQKGYKPLRRGM